MKFVKIDVKDEYERVYGKEDEEILDSILSYRLYPRKLYRPSEALSTLDPLFILPAQMSLFRMLRQTGMASLQDIRPYLFGSDVILKNEDEIIEETGMLVMVEDGSAGDAEVYRILETLYPGKICAYQAVDTLKMEGRVYQVLVQAGFVRQETLRIADNLPPMRDILLPEEKGLIHPLFDDILGRFLFGVRCVHLN